MEPRPTILSPTVVMRAANTILAQLRVACSDLSSFDSIKAQGQLAKTLSDRAGTPARLALLQAYGWPVDDCIAKVMASATEIERSTLHDCTKEWVMRTGVRFPATPGCEVSFEGNGWGANGQVIKVHRGTATANVLVISPGSRPLDLEVNAEAVRVIWDETGKVIQPVLRRMPLFRNPTP